MSNVITTKIVKTISVRIPKMGGINVVKFNHIPGGVWWTTKRISQKIDESIFATSEEPTAVEKVVEKTEDVIGTVTPIVIETKNKVSNKVSDFLDKPEVVATVHTIGGLAGAATSYVAGTFGLNKMF